MPHLRLCPKGAYLVLCQKNMLLIVLRPNSDAVLMKCLVASTKAAWLGASIAALSANYSSVILTLSSFDFEV